MQTMDPVDLATSHRAMMSSLLTNSINILPDQLWELLRNMRLSRNIANPKEFGDGLLIAEITHIHTPSLLTTQALQKLDLEIKNFPRERGVWNYLGLTAFKQLCFQITNELVSSFEAGDINTITNFLMALIQQLEQYQRIQKAFNSFTRTSFVEYFDYLTAVRTFDGTPFLCKPRLPWVQGKTVIRLSNVDYHTNKHDVQKFLYPILVDPCDIHIPVHLNTGKMMYTVFVMFDEPALPMRVIKLHSGMSLLARRVEIRMVNLDELLILFFSRGLQHLSTPPNNSDWVHEETKEKICKLCRYQRHHLGKAPDRPFEHALSFLHLLPHSQNIQFSSDEIARVFEIACVSLLTLMGLISHEKNKLLFPSDLLPRLFKTSLAIPLFNESQLHYLYTLYNEYLRHPKDPLGHLKETPVSSQKSENYNNSSQPQLFQPSQQPQPSVTQLSPITTSTFKPIPPPILPPSITIPSSVTSWTSKLIPLSPIHSPRTPLPPSSSGPTSSASSLHISSPPRTHPLGMWKSILEPLKPPSQPVSSSAPKVSPDWSSLQPRSTTTSAWMSPTSPISLEPQHYDIDPERVLGRNLWKAI